MMEWREREHTPLASLSLDLVAVNHEIAALRRDQIEVDIRTLDIQARVNRLQGALSDLTQRLELKARSKKAASEAPEAA